MVVDTAAYTLHTLLASLWAGSVVFVALAVVPLAMDGHVAPAVFGHVVSRLRTLTRVSALLLFVTGGHLAGTLYTADSLTGTTQGQLVLAMLGLWLVLAAVVEVGAARALRGVEAEKIREPARDARPFLLAGAVAAVALLVVAGLLGTPSPPY